MVIRVSAKVQDDLAMVAIRRAEEVRRVAFLAPGLRLADNGNSLLALGLLHAMRSGEDLFVNAPVTPQLLANATKIQEIFSSWDDSMRVVGIGSHSTGAQSSHGTGVGAFFSGGVDSFYTALKHIDEIDSLIFVYGFDIKLDQRATLLRIQRDLHSTSAELGKRLVEVQTDIRYFSLGSVGWRFYHGAALATVAHLLSQHFREIFIPASLSHDAHFPYGSHPAVDYLWSSPGLRLTYDGFETNRFEKIRAISQSATALKWLRVCNTPTEAGRNCGLCHKCLCTMVALEIVGAMHQCRTFPTLLDLGRIVALDLRDSETRNFWMQNLRATLDSHRSEELQAVLRLALEAH
jgi:hypothetical protein